jgi:hypothetical protein
MADQSYDMEKIERRLQSMELRLAQLESALHLSNGLRFVEPVEQINIPVVNEDSELLNEEDRGLEAQIGRFGLAWMGNIVLLFGIAFLTQYMMNSGARILSVILGYVSAGGIFFLANYLRKTNVHLAFMFKMSGMVLLFYLTLRLHFYTVSPLLQNQTLSIILLIIIIVFQVYVTIKNKSQAFGALSVVFALIIGMIGDSTHFMLPVMVIIAAGTIFYYYRFKWQPLLIITIILSYISYFLWLFGNPLAGHPFQMISEQYSGIIYLFGLGALYSITNMFRKNDSSSDDYLISVTFVNGVLFTLLLALVVLRFYSKDYVNLFAVITVCCLIFSSVLKSSSDWNFASAFYALYGFMAMSISLYGLFGLPRVYLLLSVQSLIVVSMALWFRNRLMAIMNSLLFLSILVSYLLAGKSVDGANFSFALVALVSARIINWQKSRLKIETEFMRNLYLIEGFVMVMFALYHAVPGQFVTLSWSMAALLYFLLSFVLKNVKYRYMALGTMICTALYLFIVDLARIEIIYRVLALLVLAAISIGISMYYTNRIKKSSH